MLIRIPIGTSPEDKLRFKTKIKEIFPDVNDLQIESIYNRYMKFNILQVIYELPLGIEVAYMQVTETNSGVLQYWDFNSGYINNIPNLFNIDRTYINNKLIIKDSDNKKTTNNYQKNNIDLSKIDEILQKIASNGYSSLDEDEQNLLKTV